MTTRPLFLSRVQLRRGPGSVGSLARLLADSTGPVAAHRLMWSLFGQVGSETRDFLYRDAGRGRYYTLSARPPEDHHALWDIGTKAFEPHLAPGDRLGFSLRANPVVRRRLQAGDGKSKRHDVVMDGLAHLRKSQRAAERGKLERSTGLDWLRRQAAKSGFAVTDAEVAVDGYVQHRVPRESGRPVCFSTLDYDGVLTVTNPDRFLCVLGQGLGSAKAYGCGLLFIRRI